ncbi:MAG: hypothetical protein ACRDAM_07185 [Casimicrobium sp.]
MKRFTAFLMLIAFPLQTVHALVDTTITVNRIGPDAYMVIKAPNTKSGEVVLQTKYCHAYAYNEEAIFVTAEEQHGEAAILFASGDQCEVIAVKKDSDRSFALLDFLVQLGLAYLTKGVITPKPKGK